MTEAVIDYDLLSTVISPIAQQPVEFLIVLYLDKQGIVAGLRHIRGTRGGVVLPARLFVADALAFEARSAIMAHNHPSGDPSASPDDRTATRRLARAFDTVGVRLLDHLVIAGERRTSLRAAGYL